MPYPIDHVTFMPENHCVVFTRRKNGAEVQHAFRRTRFSSAWRLARICTRLAQIGKGEICLLPDVWGYWPNRNE